MTSAEIKWINGIQLFHIHLTSIGEYLNKPKKYATYREHSNKKRYVGQLKIDVFGKTDKEAQSYIKNKMAVELGAKKERGQMGGKETLTPPTETKWYTACIL